MIPSKYFNHQTSWTRSQILHHSSGQREGLLSNRQHFSQCVALAFQLADLVAFFKLTASPTSLRGKQATVHGQEIFSLSKYLQADKASRERKKKHRQDFCIYTGPPNNTYSVLPNPSPSLLFLEKEKKKAIIGEEWQRQEFDPNAHFIFFTSSFWKLCVIFTPLPLSCIDFNANPHLRRLHFINYGGRESGTLETKVH